MIKEIMLASALTLSAPPLPHFYDINNVFYRFDLNFFEFDYQHFNSYIIDLNNGTTEIGNIYSSSSNNTYTLTDSTLWHDTYMKDFQHYLSYVYENRSSEESFNINTFYLEWDLNGSIENANTTAEEIVIDCFFAVPGSEDNTLIDVSGVKKLRLSVDYDYAYIYAYDWLNAEAFLKSDNAFLVLRTDNIQGSEEEEADFELATYYTNYSKNLYIGDIDNYIPGSYSDFIYENINSWLEYADNLEDEYKNLDYEYKMLMHEASQLVDINQQLQYEKTELTKENAELNSINQNLRQENEVLKANGITNYTFGTVIKTISENASALLRTEILPNFTIGNIIFIPVIFSLIGIIFKFFRR